MYGRAASNTGRAGPRRPPKAAHTEQNVVIDAVFHASMFASNTVALLNACEPNHTRSTPTKSARKLGTDTRARVRVRVHRNTHALGNTQLYTPTRNT